ncbi:hypothetical protein IFM89_020443 [Coptis chinensis]|uniref:Uncharacterized protein n=1 Tax=Coptis chinensis TaxID=261450 RepID=A0A835H7I8_9MAGN|nr:hypothetical protein IFM89_020443 [Coptis chinensis]
MGLAIPGKSEVNQKPRSCKQHKKIEVAGSGVMALDFRDISLWHREKAQPGATASDVNVDEVRMIVDEGETGFGFTKRNELINGKTAAIGFLLLLDFELLTGKGLLKGTGGHSFFTAYGLWLQQYSLQQLSNSVAKLV